MNLDSKAIVENFEFWRLFTYPFAYLNIESFVLSFLTLYIFSNLLENIIRKPIYPLFLFLISLLQGLLFTFVFWNSQKLLMGLEGVGLYVVILFVLLKPKEVIRIKYLPRTNSLVYGLFILSMWATIKLIALKNPDYTVPVFLFTFSFSITSALITYMLLNFFKEKGSSTNILKQTKTNPVQTPEEMSLVSNIKKMKYPNRFNEEFDDVHIVLSDNDYENEERLNKILDKINALGQNSISDSEQNFLKEYSKQLKI